MCIASAFFLLCRERSIIEGLATISIIENCGAAVLYAIPVHYDEQAVVLFIKNMSACVAFDPHILKNHELARQKVWTIVANLIDIFLKESDDINPPMIVLTTDQAAGHYPSRNLVSWI